jgi:hypothetical protein
MGSYGYTSVSLYSGPDCTGSFLFSGYLCTVNANANSFCTNLTWLFHNYWSIPHITHAIIEASQFNYHVRASTGSCQGGVGECLQLLTFIAN